MLIWGLTIIALAIALIIGSVMDYGAPYHLAVAGAVLLVSLTMMYKFVLKKPTSRQKVLEKQLDEIRRENEELRAKL